MSASDDFPRGIILGAGSGGGSTVGAGVTFPASSGIAWTLTDVKIFGNVTSAGSGDFAQYVTANGISVPVFATMSAITVGESFSDEWSGQMTFTVGQALVVTFAANNADVQEYLFATAQAA